MTPLVIFTVLAQSAVGAYWWLCVLLFWGGLTPDIAGQLLNASIVIWIIMVLAFAASSAHLGRPGRAINAVLRFGRANLSNEIVFGSAFVGFGTMGWFAQAITGETGGFATFCLIAAAPCSLAFVFAMTSFYLMPTVPGWNTKTTPLAFISTVIAGGSALALFIFAIAGMGAEAVMVRWATMLAIGAVLGSAFVGTRIGAGRKTPASTLLILLRFAALWASLVVFYATAWFGLFGNPLWVGGSLLLVLSGEALGRHLLLEGHRTTGKLSSANHSAL